jgi:hypothetical protein
LAPKSFFGQAFLSVERSLASSRNEELSCNSIPKNGIKLELGFVFFQKGD